MKITKISVYQIDVPIKPATISRNRVMSVFDETVVRIETDAGLPARWSPTWVTRRRNDASARSSTRKV